jgi:hypothetical protein
MMRNIARLLQSSHVISAGVLLFWGLSPAHASLALVDIFKNIAYQQTSGVKPTTPANFFADVEAHLNAAGDYTSVVVTYPGPGSPLSLPLENPLQFGVGPGFATQAAMDAAFPFGAYSFAASGGTSTPETDSINYTVDAYTADIPALDAATFTALQGMNAAQPFTFHFNSFTPNPNADTGTTFLTVFGSSFGTSLAHTSTMSTMAANTLAPGKTYTYELDFSDRINGTDPNTGVPTLIAFDVRTDGTFTTAAVPEPSLLFAVGMLLIGAASVGRRRRARP